MTLKEKNPMLLYFKHLHPSTPAKLPEKSGPSCYNANRNQGKHLGGTKINAIPPRESWEQQRGTTKVATSGVARVSRRAVSPFIPTPKSDVAGEGTYPCSMSLQHGQRRRRRCRLSRSGGVNTRESNEIAPVMWGVVTRVRPAPSTQTIENKRTILRHRPPAPRKTGITPYMRHPATFYKGTLYMKSAPPFASMTSCSRGNRLRRDSVTGGSRPRKLETPGHGRQSTLSPLKPGCALQRFHSTRESSGTRRSLRDLVLVVVIHFVQRHHDTR